MINKKLVGTTLVGLLTVGFAGQALAADQHITGKTNAEVEVRGNLGDTDNENPDTPLPEESDEWINVSLPTAVVFNEGPSDSIVSPSYKIKNNSGRHVKVDVKEYNIDRTKSNAAAVTALEELNIKEVGGEEEVVSLAKLGESSVTPGQNSLGKINTKETLSFAFTGKIDKSVELDDKAFVESNVVFEFKALPKDGNEK